MLDASVIENLPESLAQSGLFAKKIVEEGAKVVAISRTLSKELEQLVQSHPVKHLAIDVNTARDTNELSSKLIRAFGRIDILINNVGAIDERRGQGFLATPSEEWEQQH
ncbi:SDR family oxidoreductase [Paenibacillus sp. 7124]|uniref:SDR family oxidoreductase n=1 Tax=Paenibacillus apii TaxID=1850370 RepID=A0A6M1PL03_9BACL|nr:SDR family oxidoreductase [Paenibacillus apii]